MPGAAMPSTPLGRFASKLRMAAAGTLESSAELPPGRARDAVETVASLLADVHDGEVVAHGGIEDLDRLLASRGVTPLDMPAWHRIDAAEIELGRSHGRMRTTLAHRQELLAAAEGDGSA